MSSVINKKKLIKIKQKYTNEMKISLAAITLAIQFRKRAVQFFAILNFTSWHRAIHVTGIEEVTRLMANDIKYGVKKPGNSRRSRRRIQKDICHSILGIERDCRQIEDEEKRALRAERTCSIPDPGHVSEKFRAGGGVRDPEKLECKKLNSDRSVCTASVFDSRHSHLLNTELLGVEVAR